VKEDRNKACIREVSKVLIEVAERLEEPQKVEELKKILDTLLLQEKLADPELEVVDIFKSGW